MLVCRSNKQQKSGSYNGKCYLDLKRHTAINLPYNVTKKHSKGPSFDLPQLQFLLQYPYISVINSLVSPPPAQL